MSSGGEIATEQGPEPGFSLPRAEDLPPLPRLPVAQRLYFDARFRQRVPLRVGLRLAELRAELMWRRSAGGRAEAFAETGFLLDRSPLADEIPRIARAYAFESARRAELEWRPGLGPRFTIVGLEHLLEARAEGRGALIHFLHYGPYVHLATALKHHDVDVWAPISDYFYATPVPGLTGHKDRTHLHCLLAGCLPFPASGTFNIIGGLLERGETVGMGSDLPGSLPATLLGRRIRLSSGFARLSVASGAPICCATFDRPTGELPTIRFHPPIDSRRHREPASLQQAILDVHEPAVLAWPEALERPRMRWKLDEDAVREAGGVDA